MIKVSTKNFILYMNEKFKVIFARCKKSGKFVALKKAIEEYTKEQKYSVMSVLFSCVLAVFNAGLYLSNVLSVDHLVLFNILTILIFINYILCDYLLNES